VDIASRPLNSPTLPRSRTARVIAQVQEKTGIAAAEQRLIFKGQVLKVGAE